MSNTFYEMENDELYQVDGGMVIWAFAIGFCVAGCGTAGVYYGYKKESQGE